MAKSCHLAGALLLLLAAVASGCGSGAVRQTPSAAGAPAVPNRAEREEAVRSARESFLAAEAAGGEYADPYSYYMAKEYLELAEEELNGGDIRGVIVFSEKSRRHSAALAGAAEGVSR